MHGKAAYCHVLNAVVRQIKVSRYRLRCIFIISVQFSLLSDAELDELVLEYMGRHGFTTGRVPSVSWTESSKEKNS